MGFIVFRVFFFFVFISFLLFLGFLVKFEFFLNEIVYDGRYFKFKIVVEEIEVENIVFIGNVSLDVLVSGDDGDGGNVVGIMVIFFEFGLIYVKEMFVN